MYGRTVPTRGPADSTAACLPAPASSRTASMTADISGASLQQTKVRKRKRCSFMLLQELTVCQYRPSEQLQKAELFIAYLAQESQKSSCEAALCCDAIRKRHDTNKPVCANCIDNIILRDGQISSWHSSLEPEHWKTVNVGIDHQSHTQVGLPALRPLCAAIASRWKAAVWLLSHEQSAARRQRENLRQQARHNTLRPKQKCC